MIEGYFASYITCKESELCKLRTKKGERKMRGKKTSRAKKVISGYIPEDIRVKLNESFGNNKKGERKMKTCAKCKLPKNEKEFYKHKKTVDGLQSYCKDCCKKHNNNRYSFEKSNKVIRLDLKDYKTVILSKIDNVKEYNELIFFQNNSCYFCYKKLTGEVYADVYKKTNSIEILMCKKCAFMLTGFRVDIKSFTKVVKYLKGKK